jgi:hypothetical protein
MHVTNLTTDVREWRKLYLPVAADFNSLPGVRIPGTNAPLVASQEPGGKSTDHESYLENPGGADIFFPTDFEHLVRIDAVAVAAAAAARRRGYAGGDATATRTGEESAATERREGTDAAAAAARWRRRLDGGEEEQEDEEYGDRVDSVVMTTRQFMELHADLDATVGLHSLPGGVTRLVTWTILAVTNWCF